MKKSSILFFTLAMMICHANADELVPLSPVELEQMQQKQALIVDIRTEEEWQATGVIAASQKLQAFDSEGNWDQNTWVNQLQKIRNHDQQPVVLVCRSGNRSEKLGQILSKQLGLNGIYHLSGGIKGWSNANKPLIANCTKTSCP